MTPNELHQLVEFLGRKFDAIDGRFEAIDRRFDAVEHRLTKVEVVGEETRHHVQVLAEGLTSLAEQMDLRFTGVDEELRAVHEEMAQGFSQVRQDIRGLAVRVDRLERAS